jgi:hypothetical protein
MLDKTILIESDLRAVRENHELLTKQLKETFASIEKLNLEKDKFLQLLAIKVGEFQAITRVLEILKTDKEAVETVEVVESVKVEDK